MFEKEAEEYLNEHSEYDEIFDMVLVKCDTKNAFKDGAEFGYNKANEWHFVKDGDLPKETKEYLVYKIDGYGCKSIQVMQFNNKHCWCANCQNDVIAWKEIVLPELKEVK